LTDAPAKRSLRAHAPTAAAIAIFLLIGLVLYGSAGHDDSHITYWAALALRRFGKIVNYNGDRVEQSSSLAHVVLLALLGALTRLDMPALGPITSIAGGAATVALSAPLAARLAPAAPAARWGAALCVATAASFVYWSFGGLETTLFTAAALVFLITAARYLEAPSRRPLARAAAVTLLLLCARPEAPLVVACTLIVALAHAAHRRALRPALVLAAVAAAEALLVFGFRRAYFGAFFPNPVYTKATGLEPAGGLRYLAANLLPAGAGIVAFAVLGLALAAKDAVVEKEARFPAVLTGAFVIAYTGFIVLTGGDWMAGGRFVAHVLPLLCVLAAAAAARVIGRARWTAAAVAILVAANLYGVFALADGVSLGRPIWSTSGLRAGVDARVGPRGYSWFELVNKVHLRDTTIAASLVDVVSALRKARPDRVLTVMSSQAGMVAYHAFAQHYGAIRFLDTCSLVTRDLLSCLPASKFDRRQVGMQLPIDRYFRDEAAIDAQCGTRRPDIVFGLGHRGIEPVLERHGYTIVVHQRGRIDNEGWGKRFKTPLDADEFIAVDSALLAGVDFPVQPAWTWDIR
jgi:hypothetical protein